MESKTTNNVETCGDKCHSAKIKEKCSAPWYNTGLYVWEDSVSMQPCCYLPGSYFKISETDFDINTVINNPVHQQIRKDLVNANPKSLCTKWNCKYYNTDTTLAFDSSVANVSEEGLRPEQIENLRLAKKEYSENAIEVNSVPLCIGITFGFKCNFDCPMCPQRPLAKKHPYTLERFPAETLLKLKPLLKKTLVISVIGGEPFVLKECVKFLDAITKDPDFKTVKLDLWSNAIFIDKYWDILKRHPQLTLTVSPDSIGDTYEYIRRNGKWAKFESNIKMFNKIAKENNLTWNINSHNILMKSTIDKIVEFSTWSVENNINSKFTILTSIGEGEEFCSNEDVIKYPKLLNDIENWEEKMQKAIEIFKNANQKDAVETLSFYKEYIKNPPKETVASSTELQFEDSDSDFERKKINILGIKISYKVFKKHST